MNVYTRLTEKLKTQKGLFFVLLDPDRQSPDDLAASALLAQEAGADALLAGSSLLVTAQFNGALRDLKTQVKIPVILFPANAYQVCPHADAILFLSLLSGRNPQYLIGEQVNGAPLVKAFGLEPIPTGYLLIESGKPTSVAYMSGTQPIPADKPDIAKAHALAAEYFGMKFVYLEAGSGAVSAVPDALIRAVRDYVSVPLIVGGGIRSPEVARQKVVAGASAVVVGHALEQRTAPKILREFADAIHG